LTSQFRFDGSETSDAFAAEEFVTTPFSMARDELRESEDNDGRVLETGGYPPKASENKSVLLYGVQVQVLLLEYSSTRVLQ
jgi:hypothetical protein